MSDWCTHGDDGSLGGCEVKQEMRLLKWEKEGRVLKVYKRDEGRETTIETSSVYGSPTFKGATESEFRWSVG